jgi:hypothetical protein
MTQLSADAAILRFKENEVRVNTFVNEFGQYQTNTLPPSFVETLPSFIQRMTERYLSFHFEGNWLTSTNYQIQDLVKQSDIVYICLEDHTSGTFATDLASGKWAVYQGVTKVELAQPNGVDFVGGSGRCVDNIEDLRDLSKLGTPKAFVFGYYEKGDGGGGAYYYDSSDTTSVDNGGTVIVATDGGRWKLKHDGRVSVKQFGAKGNCFEGVGNDDTLPIQTAINSMPFGGVVYAPQGQYKTTAKLLMKTGVSLIGDGYWNSSALLREGVTSIYAVHTGAAILSLKGAIGCTVSDISLQGSQTAKPKTGLLLGRSSAASAGFHTIRKVSICGWYTIAAIYSIASEDNYWEDVITWNFGGDALYGLVTSVQDVFNVDGLVTSTNLTNIFKQLKIINTSPSGSAAGIYVEGSESMGSWHFFGCYLTQYAGAYIRINNGAIDGKAMFGPLSFIGVSGEPLEGGNPLVGIDLTAPVAVNLAGLTVTGARFQLAANAEGAPVEELHYDIRQSSNVTLLQPNIVIQPPEAFPYAISEIFYNKIKGGIVSVGRDYEWNSATLLSGWSNTYGSPYAAAGYKIDQTGKVKLRGTVQGASLGTIFVLPVKYRPAFNMFFPIFTNGQVLGRILVDVSGNVTITAGNLTNIDLTSVNFDLN